MSSHSEPSAETLTAEIRGLQVGSKPVTLSAARQLDHVNPADIKPFGRVRIDPKPGRMIEVISWVNGTLARSSADASEGLCPGYLTRGTRYRDLEAACPSHRGTREADAAGQHNWMRYAPSQELYESWLALPLIVLAGLR